MPQSIQVSAVPSITIFVRHTEDCPRKADEFYKNCRCHKHLRWTYAGRQHRQAARTRIWKLAEDARRKIEAQYEAADPTNPIQSVSVEAKAAVTIERAVQLYVLDKQSQGLGGGVLKKYERELERFSDFMAQRSKRFPHEISLDTLTEFRAEWSDTYPSSTTRAKVQERLRGFLRYCYEARLIDRVPNLSPIKVDEPPTMPLSPEQYTRLLEVVPDEFPAPKAQRVHAFLQLMRFSGLAVGDTVRLERDELLFDSKKRIYRVVTDRQKTGTDVSVALPPEVAAEVISSMELNRHPKYIFWNTGTGKLQTAVTNWHHDLRQIFRAAGQLEGHPHQLRDTFAVSLLERGIPLEEVSKLLGHTSIKTTEKYYAKWVKARQDRLDDLVMATWTSGPALVEARA